MLNYNNMLLLDEWRRRIVAGRESRLRQRLHPLKMEKGRGDLLFREILWTVLYRAHRWPNHAPELTAAAAV